MLEKLHFHANRSIGTCIPPWNYLDIARTANSQYLRWRGRAGHKVRSNFMWSQCTSPARYRIHKTYRIADVAKAMRQSEVGVALPCECVASVSHGREDDWHLSRCFGTVHADTCMNQDYMNIVHEFHIYITGLYTGNSSRGILYILCILWVMLLLKPSNLGWLNH